MSDGVPTWCMSFFDTRQRGHGARPRFLIVARSALMFRECCDAHKIYNVIPTFLDSPQST